MIPIFIGKKRAPLYEGKKVYGKWFECLSVVDGQSGGQLVASMIYTQSMTSDFFIKWFKTQLLLSLSERHIIVMDNASFHPKGKLDNLCIAHNHYFFLLPAYSPEFNPIEQTWDNLKENVRELLRKFSSARECLECCL
ncbi:transposase [Streptococcus merionis]|uniref:transposase n=1 Tax=Streptococcus merionis TaxID=400065 RepID=UPI00351944B0